MSLSPRRHSLLRFPTAFTIEVADRFARRVAD
jgi:hypothetical protein